MINNQKLVTVLVNCYNSEHYIHDCLRSLINQTHSNIQIIVWDNQSTDHTAKIVNSFKDQRISYYFSNKFQNLVDARINALKHTNGDYIAILDSDDVAHKNRIENQLQIFLSDQKIGVVGGAVNYIDSNGLYLKSKYFELNNNILKKRILYKFPFNNSTLMFRKFYFDKVNGYNSNYAYINDYDLVYRISKVSKIVNSSNILSSNRLHYNNLSKQDFIFMQNELLVFLKKIRLTIYNKYLFNLNTLSQIACHLRLFRYLFKKNLYIKAFSKCSPIIILVFFLILYNLNLYKNTND